MKTKNICFKCKREIKDKNKIVMRPFGDGLRMVCSDCYPCFFPKFMEKIEVKTNKKGGRKNESNGA